MQQSMLDNKHMKTVPGLHHTLKAVVNRCNQSTTVIGLVK